MTLWTSAATPAGERSERGPQRWPSRRSAARHGAAAPVAAPPRTRGRPPRARAPASPLPTATSLTMTARGPRWVATHARPLVHQLEQLGNPGGLAKPTRWRWTFVQPAVG